MMYRCIENDELFTRDELEKSYLELLANGETEIETFSDYLNACLDKNGSLEIVTASKQVYTKTRDRRIITDKEKNELFAALSDVACMFDRIGYHGIADEIVYLIGNAKEELGVDYDANYNETTEQFEINY